MKKSDKILILGSNGFAGSALFNRLERERYEHVFAFDREYVDLLDQYKTNGAIAYGFDYVFICSAIVGGIQANLNDPYRFLHENLVIQNNVINACIRNHVKKVLFIGSSCIYPKDYKQPLKEEYLLNAPLEPTNEGYALAKIAGLKMCEYANSQFDTKFICLMPCNLYGPSDHFDSESSHVLAALVHRMYYAKMCNADTFEVWGTGNQKREFLYIDDFVDAMIWFMNNVEKTDTFVNIGTGQDIYIKELAEQIKELIGFKGELIFNTDKPDGMKRKCLDVTKMKGLGWEPRTTLEVGLRETIENYISERHNR